MAAAASGSTSVVRVQRRPRAVGLPYTRQSKLGVASTTRERGMRGGRLAAFSFTNLLR